jgi:hypothetical protein
MMATHTNFVLQLIVASIQWILSAQNIFPHLLLFCIKDAPAIMTAPLTYFSLQLMVEFFCEISFHFCEDCRIFCEGEYQVKEYSYAIDKHHLPLLAVGLILAFGHNLALCLIMAFGLIVVQVSLVNIIGQNCLDGVIGIGHVSLINLVGLSGICNLVDQNGIIAGRTGPNGLIGVNCISTTIKQQQIQPCRP